MAIKMQPDMAVGLQLIIIMQILERNIKLIGVSPQLNGLPDKPVTPKEENHILSQGYMLQK